MRDSNSNLATGMKPGTVSGKKRAVSMTLALAPVIVVAVLWILRSVFGIDLGVWQTPDDSLAPADDGCYSLSAAGEGISTYFTVPQTEPCVAGGLDEILAADIDSAKRSVDVAAFDLDLQSVTDALVNAKKRAVQVRVVLESDNADLDQPEMLAAAGIPVVEDGRSSVMHNKFVIIDNSITWTGSWNLTNNGTLKNNNHAIRMVSDEVSASYTREFEEMFIDDAFGPSSPANTEFPRTRIGDVEIELYFAPEDGVMNRLINLVGGAQHSIYFLAFSFTDDDLAAEMRERALDGVLVEGVFESRGVKTDTSEYQAMSESGITVWKDGNPAIMHHKVIVIDQEIVVAGSFNFSQNADNQNDENLVIFYDKVVAAGFIDEFNKVVAQARP